MAKVSLFVAIFAISALSAYAAIAKKSEEIQDDSAKPRQLQAAFDETQENAAEKRHGRYNEPDISDGYYDSKSGSNYGKGGKVQHGGKGRKHGKGSKSSRYGGKVQHGGKGPKYSKGSKAGSKYGKGGKGQHGGKGPKYRKGSKAGSKHGKGSKAGSTYGGKVQHGGKGPKYSIGSKSGSRYGKGGKGQHGGKGPKYSTGSKAGSKAGSTYGGKGHYGGKGPKYSIGSKSGSNYGKGKNGKWGGKNRKWGSKNGKGRKSKSNYGKGGKPPKVSGMSGGWTTGKNKGKKPGHGKKYKTSYDCVKNPCENEGVCCQDGGYSRCICPAGFTGNQCETDIDECARRRSPCPRGAQCFDQINGYSCLFPDSDEVCKQKQTDCSSAPCKNGGTCEAHVKKGYKCECAAGFAGRNCQTDIDECENGPCFNGGKCVDGINKFTCHCPPGYGGPLCQTKQGGCGPAVCLNNADCMVEEQVWSCVCKLGYTGERCQHVVNDCSTNPCKNGGTCCEVGNGFVCQCDDGFSGLTCTERDYDLYVPEGQGSLGFKESGTDNPKSKRFSRRCRFEDDKNCVVCGRGYELKTKSKKQVLDDLVKICKFSKKIARKVAMAAGLSGQKAKDCLKKYRLDKIRFKKNQQKRLFERDFRREEDNADKFLKKRCKKGFQIKKLKAFIRDLTVSLYKEGDFQDDTPEKKRCAQRLEQDIQSNDLKRIKSLLYDRDFWIKKMKVKSTKFEYRKKACQNECRKTGGC